MYTAANAFLEALTEAGVSHIFANLGSDHTALVEALAIANSERRAVPRLITCPNEMVALGAAHGYAQISGKPQAVFVHVECGTQALAGAVHNAAKGRVPVLIFAGTSPMTQEGEMRGGRNEFIHWLQDVFDQRGIVRQYMRYDNEIRTGVNIKQIVWRALQFASSDPQGPVYLMAAREVLEQEVPRIQPVRAHWPLVPPVPAPEEFIVSLADATIQAKSPLIVTSYAGRNPAVVGELVKLCRHVAVGVVESVPVNVNFPADHPMHLGFQGNEQRQNPVLAAADFILVIDSDVPWMQTVNKPRTGVPVFHIDVDPLKEQMPLWQLPAQKIAKADAATALRQLNARLAGAVPDSAGRARYAEMHDAWRSGLAAHENPDGESITPEFLTARIREHIDGNVIVLSEGVTNYRIISDHIGVRPVEGMFSSGGGSLGWSGAAAIGFKLARPDKTIVALTGDGSYLFSQPSTVHWMARRYRTPFLQVVYNNGGWRAPRLSATAVHPHGHAASGDEIGVAFPEPPDYAGIAAAAGGAFARTVERAGELDAAIDAALHAVHVEGRCAVLDVLLPRTA